MLLVLVVSFICLSAAAPVSRHQRTPGGAAVRVAAAANAKAPYDKPTGSWVETNFLHPSCEGSSDYSYMGNYGVCMSNLDAKGKPMDAYVEVFNMIDDNFIYTSYLSFGPPYDCSGEPSSVQNTTASLKCDTHPTESWIKGYAPASAEPWAPFTKGVVKK